MWTITLQSLPDLICKKLSMNYETGGKWNDSPVQKDI